MNLTVNQPINTNFKAVIKPTKYLEKGFNTAFRDIKLNPPRAQKFYESLKAISETLKFSNFSIEAKGRKLNYPRAYQIKVDNYKIEGPSVPEDYRRFDGEQCVEHIIDFAKTFLGKKHQKTAMPIDELVGEMGQLKDYIFKGPIKTIKKAVQNEIKEIKAIIEQHPEYAESLEYRLDSCKRILKKLKELK